MVIYSECWSVTSVSNDIGDARKSDLIDPQKKKKTNQSNIVYSLDKEKAKETHTLSLHFATSPCLKLGSTGKPALYKEDISLSYL